MNRYFLAPILVGFFIGGCIFPILWIQQIIPDWFLFIGIIPLLLGGFITSIMIQTKTMESCDKS